MTPLYYCSFLFRTTLSICVLLCVVLTGFVIIFAAFNKKSFCFAVNFLSFISEFFLLFLLNLIVKNKAGITMAKFLLNISHLPAYVFVLLSVVSLLILIFSIIKNRHIFFVIFAHRNTSDDDYLLCRRAEQLQADNLRLINMNNQMKLYGREMQIQIKQKEILEAKTQIHNGMNKLLMISSKAIESGDESEIKKAMELWHKDALLLCKEAKSEEFSNAMQDIKSLAEVLNIKLIINNMPTELDEKTAILFERSACEAMINAVKHANADIFEISVTDTGFSFFNDGILPKGEIRFGGGLNTVKSLANESGYKMTIECGERFNLTLTKTDNGN